MTVAVIADIVGSRALSDRATAQQNFQRVIADVEQARPLASSPLRPTVGDEFQAVYPALDAALASLLLVQLALPEGLELRFGIGVGAITDVTGGSVALQDGPGWWAARDAIDIVEARQQRSLPGARTWIVGDPDEDRHMHDAINMANAYVLLRDQFVTRMTERERRLTYGRCLLRTQAALAQAEGISQPAVSQALQSAGSVAIIAGWEVLNAGVERSARP